MATRTVIAMGERMPEVAAEFYQQGPRQCAGRLAQHLAPQVEAGVLAIDESTWPPRSSSTSRNRR